MATLKKHPPTPTYIRARGRMGAGRMNLHVRAEEKKRLRKDDLPSMVGTGLPLASNVFCVKPSLCKTGDSLIVDSLTSLCGLKIDEEATKRAVSAALVDGNA